MKVHEVYAVQAAFILHSSFLTHALSLLSFGKEAALLSPFDTHYMDSSPCGGEKNCMRPKERSLK